MPSIYCETTKQFSWTRQLGEILQMCVNRLCVGEIRYGTPDPTQDYVARAERALARYRRNGNKEQLLDAANYCILEYRAPLHPDAHLEITDSEGRNKKI